MRRFDPEADVPFQASWIDRLVGWIDRLPFPAWLFFLGAVGATALVINVILWVDGSVPYGTTGSIQGIFPPFVFYFLALYQYLTHVGSQSLRTFRPLLAVDDQEIAKIDYELATLPRWLGWLAILLGVAFTPPYFRGDTVVFGDLVPKTPLPYVVAVLATGFFGATFLGVLIRSVRQLRMVHKLHAQATNVNLLKLEPAHAFSRLTAVTGIGVILVVILGYFYNPSAIGSAWIVLSYLVIALLAVVIFVVPVIGIRDRLVEEKRRAVHETSDLLQMTIERLHSRVRNDTGHEVRDSKDAIEALIRERELMEKISTWPWDPRTIRGFTSTLLLPIFLWLVTRLLERLV